MGSWSRSAPLAPLAPLAPSWQTATGAGAGGECAEAAIMLALAPVLEALTRPVLRHVAGRTECARLFAFAMLGTLVQWLHRGRFVLDSHVAVAVPSALVASTLLEGHPMRARPSARG